MINIPVYLHCSDRPIKDNAGLQLNLQTLVPRRGLEPPRLAAAGPKPTASTIPPSGHIKHAQFFWLERQDSNLHSPESKSGALPIKLLSSNRNLWRTGRDSNPAVTGDQPS
jgi:hypothetical protein